MAKNMIPQVWERSRTKRMCLLLYVQLYCCMQYIATAAVHHVWTCHARMMLPAAACAAGHGCSVFRSLLSAHGWVCSRGKKTQIDLIGSTMLRTVDAKVLNPRAFHGSCPYPLVGSGGFQMSRVGSGRVGSGRVILF